MLELFYQTCCACCITDATARSRSQLMHMCRWMTVIYVPEEVQLRAACHRHCQWRWPLGLRVCNALTEPARTDPIRAGSRTPPARPTRSHALPHARPRSARNCTHAARQLWTAYRDVLTQVLLFTCGRRTSLCASPAAHILPAFSSIQRPLSL